MSAKLSPGCYYGEKIFEQSTMGLRLSECRYAPSQIVESHIHERAYFSLVLQGAYTETTRTHESEYFASSVILHPAGEQHSDRFHDQEARVFNVEISGDWPARIGENSSPLSRRWERRGGASGRLMQSLYREFRRDDGVSSLAVEGLALELMAELVREASPPAEYHPPRWLEDARYALQRRFTEPVTLVDIAAACDVHPTHLARLFRRHYRCSVGEYVRECRVRFACTLVAQAEIPLAEIARSAGFADQSHFSRVFKRHYGISPARYRESRLNR
jgi:AraC family transcriptional regulator